MEIAFGDHPIDHQIVPQTLQIADPGNAQKLVRPIQIRRQDFVGGVFFLSVDIDVGVPEGSAENPSVYWCHADLRLISAGFEKFS